MHLSLKRKPAVSAALPGFKHYSATLLVRCTAITLFQWKMSCLLAKKKKKMQLIVSLNSSTLPQQQCKDANQEPVMHFVRNKSMFFTVTSHRQKSHFTSSPKASLTLQKCLSVESQPLHPEGKKQSTSLLACLSVLAPASMC